MGTNGLILLSSLFIVASGCLGGGDGSSIAIQNWNDVIEKQNETVDSITQLSNQIDSDSDILRNELSRDDPNFNLIYSILDKWENSLEMSSELVQQEGNRISTFAGSTVSLTGDLRSYADEALTNIRAANNYQKSGIRNYGDGISAFRQVVEDIERENYDEETFNNKVNDVDDYFEKGDADFIKADSYMGKATDAISKVEGLQ